MQTNRVQGLIGFRLKLVSGFRCQVSGTTQIYGVGLDSDELIAGCADHKQWIEITWFRRAQRSVLLRDKKLH